MDHGPLDQSMFWVGALFVFMPMIFAGIVLGVWWYGKKRKERSEHEPDPPGHGM
ncbi:MAG: hypothetical protein HY560_04275 [Gemmatimonadetes bacterium]|nr:hypothetical protein [Gemmatimonadota bacterium]